MRLSQAENGRDFPLPFKVKEKFGNFEDFL
jgi:hypothetical protein